MSVGSHASAFADGAAYEASLGRPHAYYIRLKADLLLRLVRRHRPQARRLVDLGCGTGEMAQALSGADFDLTGVDLSPQMIEYAKGKNIPRAKFMAADAARTGLSANSFDVAFATALFHHVPPAGRGALAQEMARLLVPGGLALVFEHNPLNPITRRIVRACPVDEGVVLAPRRQVRAALEAAGLEVLGHRYLVFFPHAFRALRQLERALAWLPIGGQYVVLARKTEGTHGGRG